MPSPAPPSTWKTSISNPFDPSGELTVPDLQDNYLTLENIRLWDTRPLLESNRQLQQIRLYYEFKDADVDRYSILTPDRQQRTAAGAGIGAGAKLRPGARDC